MRDDSGKPLKQEENRMLLLDTDIFVDIFRGFLPALHWFEGHDKDTELLVPGYVVMELLQGRRGACTEGYRGIWGCMAFSDGMRPSA